MSDRSNVLVMNLNVATAQQVLREVAEDSARVFFTDHAEERMQTRCITRVQVLRCLRHGRIVEGPVRDVRGNWALKVEVLSAGDVLTVAAALDHDEHGNLVVVITTYR